MNHDATIQDPDGPSPHTRNDQFDRLTDEQVITLLEAYRSRDTGAPGEFDAAIVELELEAVRRNLEMPAIIERTPTGLALERCRHWIRVGHYDAAADCMWDLSIIGAWRLYLDIQRVDVTKGRLFLLKVLLHGLDTSRFGDEAARERASFLDTNGLDHDEIEAYLRSCLAAHFDDWMMGNQP